MKTSGVWNNIVAKFTMHLEKKEICTVELQRILELFLLKAVFEEHHDRRRDPVDVTVLAHGYHTIAVHGLSGEELQLLKPAEDVLHDFVHVGFKHVDLVGGLLFQFCY